MRESPTNTDSLPGAAIQHPLPSPPTHHNILYLIDHNTTAIYTISSHLRAAGLLAREILHIRYIRPVDG